MLWLIGGILTFKWLYDKKVLSGRPSPAPAKRRIAQRRQAEPAGDESGEPGVGEDYYPEHQMIRPKKEEKPKPAPKPPEAKKPAAAPPPTVKEEISVPKGHKGSMDDIIEDDPGIGIEEFPELQDDGTLDEEEEES